MQSAVAAAAVTAATTVARSGRNSSNIMLHRTIPSIRAIRQSLHPSNTVGFVPTMGALHEGHLSLVRNARKHNDTVIVSIFVNPTQFGKGEDFDKYPRQLEQDLDALSDLGVDHLFAPDKDDIYRKNHVTFVDPMGYDEYTSEGRSRPGHFRGVATIVTKLFNIIQPSNAYFGQKDATQCSLIQRIVDDLDIPTNIVIGDTVREIDGLAMSSRNAYLTPQQRKAAPILYQSLMAAQTLYTQTQQQLQQQQHNQQQKQQHHCPTITATTALSSDQLRATIVSVLQTEPLVDEIQYIAIDDMLTMQPIDDVKVVHNSTDKNDDVTSTNSSSNRTIISLACKIGNVRLIDNIILK